MYVIKLKIKDEDDLYDPFAYEEQLLSDDVKSYVLKRLAKRGIGAFSMWEAASIWILQNPMLRLRRRVNRKIKNNGEIKFRCAKHAGTSQDSEGSGI